MKIPSGNVFSLFMSGLRSRGALCAVLGLPLLAGCGTFSRLGKNVEQLEKDVYLRGRVAQAPNQPGQVIVAVLARTGEEPVKFFDLAVLSRDESDFAFSLPPKDGYQVGAFRDENGDEAFQDNEPVWLSGELRAQDFKDGRRSPVLEVALRPGLPIPQDVLARLRETRAGRKLVELSAGNQIQSSLGKIADFNTPCFTPDAAKLGLWEPVTFLNKYGTGVYFLELYDPSRIPVLCVHGAGGSPGDWKSFVPMLDKTKYQIWLYSYPSGLRIEESARILQGVVTRLHERYGFKRLDVIAHSMGGLVSRKFVLDAVAAGNAPYLNRYITLSTPWAGHEAAGMGVKHGPAVIPCWIDLQPSSEFQIQLLKRTLPESIEHHLGFSFHGGSVIALPESNDGVVSVVSQLAPSAQQQARTIRGFDATHESILSSFETGNWVSEILAAPPAKKKKK